MSAGGQQWTFAAPAPTGYDAANLYLHSLPVPDVTERVRKEFAHFLGAPHRPGRRADCLY
ncbi:hypothetical protein [Streptomyces sp. x-19]|uniref:hypothetical protein n=1 Tax=Streptomyces sp. x-19 TaxID=2789280 RepID=UPI00397EF344